jgi:putative tryptophan/tyrosine transport system substrate-binding protein
MNHQSRRQFVQHSLSLAALSLLSGCGVVPLPWQPTPSRPRIPRIGYLAQMTTAPSELEAFRDGLHQLGYVEGQSIVIEVRRSEGTEQFAAPAAELVALPVELIVTSGGPVSTQAVMGATRTIPIVLPASPDPVRSGLVASLARPGGNVTGLSAQAPEAQGKLLQLLRELAPGVSRITYLAPTAGAEAAGVLREAEQAAQLLGVELLTPNIRTAADLADAFAMSIDHHAEALWAGSSPLIGGEVIRIVEFATAQRLPVLSQTRSFAEAGGLLSYGPNRLAQFRRAATYVDRILKGANPAEMPVEQPTEFELVINIKTAQALGLSIPPTVLAQATEIIQ